MKTKLQHKRSAQADTNILLCTGARLKIVNEPRSLPVKRIVNEGRAVGLSYEEQNFENDEHNCRAVGCLTCHGI